MNNIPRLEVLISTYGDAGMTSVASHLLPRVAGVSYVVSCQYGDSQPSVPTELANRDDVRVVYSHSRGLSVNRNHSIAVARTPYVLLADDDLDFHERGLKAVIEYFDTHGDVDVVTFRHIGPAKKVYPPDGHDLSKLYRNYYVSSVEIAFRLDAVRRVGLKFNEQMGIGNDYISQGEEEVFILDAMEAGLKGRFCDTAIATHAEQTSGTRKQGPGAMRARGVILSRTHPKTLLLRAAAIAWRERANAPVLRTIRHILEGARFARQTK